MQLTTTQKVGVTFFILVVAGLLVYFLIKKKAKNTSKVFVTINKVQQVLQINVSNMDLTDFVNTILSAVKISQDVTWTSIIIDKNSIQLDSYGHISKDFATKKLDSFTGENPSTITFLANYANICEQPKKTCPPCQNGQAQKAVCNSSGEWICVPSDSCPDFSSLANCCTNNPNGPYPTCLNGQITCGPCPENLKPNCGDPTCALIGPQCTSTGWICSPGYACPSGDELKKCCAGDKNASCIIDKHGRAILSCTTCPGNPISCDTECDMCGAVCQPDNTWACKAGVSCPPQSKLNNCCTDPDNPVGSCPQPDPNSTEDCGSSVNKIICSGCGDKPTKVGPNGEYKECLPPPEGQGGSCQGHGWVCTATGWQCSPGVQCPSPSFDSSQCCKGAKTVPTCSKESGYCVQCSCPPGQTGPPNSACGSSPDFCCPDGDGMTQCGASYLCCPKDRANCQTMKCCPVGTVYDGNGNCVVVCGTDSSGNAFACDVDQSCLEIDGLNPNQIAELEKEYGSKVRINNNSAFICKSNNLSCQYGNESSLPPSIDNYYPCLPLPSSDSSVAYCTSDDQTKISTCFNSHNNESTCVKDPNCTWRDVMKYVSSNLDINGSIQKIQTDMNVIQGKSGGYYCDSTQDKTSYSRVIAYPSSGCDWDSCWSRLAQPSIIGVRYNADTGNCIAMQSCNNPSAGMNSWSTSAGGSNPGQRVPNPDKVNIFGNNNSSFPACQGSSCPIPSSDTAFKCGTNGKIYSGCDKCTNQQTCVDSDTCDCSQAGMYGKNCDVRVGTLQYSDDQGNLYLNYDMAYPANANVNFETTSNSKWYFKQDGTNSLRNFDQTSYPAIGANTQNWYGGSQNVFSYNSLCLGNSSGNCSEIKTLYSSTGKIPDSDNILKSDSTSIPGGQCNGVCYPNLITYRGEDGIVSAWSSPRYPCSEYGSPCWDTPANSYIEGTPVTWVDMSLSPDEKQRAMQL